MICQKRTAVAFLLLSLLAVGCAGEVTKTDIETTNTGIEGTAETETVVTENALPDNLPDMDFGGAIYTMYLRVIRIIRRTISWRRRVPEILLKMPSIAAI